MMPWTLSDPGFERMTHQPATIGPYRILTEIGRGGMGVVYRAQHIQTGDLFAVKTVRLALERQVSSLAREIEALSRIEHPGVVRIVDRGARQGLPWYAMELLEGVTLQNLFDDGWRRSNQTGATPDEVLTAQVLAAQHTGQVEPSTDLQQAPRGAPTKVREPSHLGVAVGTLDPMPATAMEAARKVGGVEPRKIARALGSFIPLLERLCGVLAFIHGAGIVHRDLKPENIFVRSNREVVLVDFGLVSRVGALGREVLDVHSRMLGTALYMSPEQIRGDLVDPRADLYALGCILYTMLTWLPPFVRASTEDVLRAHLEDEPAPISSRVVGVPEALERLVMRLLAKRPEERPGHALDVAAILATLGDGPTEVRASLHRPKDYLYRSTFVGRDGLLELLGDAVASAQNRRGQVVLVGGESGMGKTRLVMEVAREALVRRINVVDVQCNAPEEGPVSPLWPMRKVLALMVARCRQKGAAETERIFGPRGPLLASILPDIASLHGQIELEPPEPLLTARQDNQRLFKALRESIWAMVKAGPLLLIFDELQGVDDAMLLFLASLASDERLEDRGLLVVATYRSDEVRPTLQELLARRAVRHMRLERLDPRSVRQMICDMLSTSDPPAPMVAYLQRHCGGNPFFVVEYLYAAVHEGVLTRSADGSWHLSAKARSDVEVALPNSLRGLVARRLDALSPSARLLVDVLVLARGDVDLGVLARLKLFAPGALLQAMHEAIGRHVLVEGPGGVLRFAHGTIAAQAAERLSDDNRKRIQAALDPLDGA